MIFNGHSNLCLFPDNRIYEGWIVIVSLLSFAIKNRLTLSFLLLILYFFEIKYIQKNLIFSMLSHTVKIYKVKVYILNGRRCDEHLFNKFRMGPFPLPLSFFEDTLLQVDVP